MEARAPKTKQPPAPRVDDPGYWRFRAANTRELANETKDENSKMVLLQIAESYEALAQRAEELRRKPESQAAGNAESQGKS